LKKSLLAFALLVGIFALSKYSDEQVATILPPDPEGVRYYVAELQQPDLSIAVQPTIIIEEA
jgi:hypothetical protein